MSAPSSIANGFSDAVGCDRTAASLDQSQLCFQCALNGHSCCQGHDIYVTWGDCRRIFSHTRQKGFYDIAVAGIWPTQINPKTRYGKGTFFAQTAAGGCSNKMPMVIASF